MENKKKSKVDEKYQICTRCVMDTTDPDIVFDEHGYCNHCTNAIERLKQPPYGLSPSEKEKALSQLIDNIKNAGKNKQYDCLIGLSGGVDSSYVAYLVKEWGLRPLGIHVDNGWNSKEGDNNVKNICKFLNIDLITNVLDWESFKDLQLAFLKASTPDSEIPSDNILAAILFRTANHYNIKYILSGCNSSSESILPKAWSQGHYDSIYIKGVYKKFGTKRKLKDPLFSIYRLRYYLKFKKIQWIDSLDYVFYDKERAKKYLMEHLSWQDYGRKHGESVYTRIYQEYILPTKFGFDKRRAHLSSLIAAGQLSREDAIVKLIEPLYANQTNIDNDITFLCNKLGITKNDFDEIMHTSPKTIKDYPNTPASFLYQSLSKIKRIIKP